MIVHPNHPLTFGEPGSLGTIIRTPYFHRNDQIFNYSGSPDVKMMSDIVTNHNFADPDENKNIQLGFRWWFSNMFLFSTLCTWGNDPNFDLRIFFRNGWRKTTRKHPKTCRHQCGFAVLFGILQNWCRWIPSGDVFFLRGVIPTRWAQKNSDKSGQKRSNFPMNGGDCRWFSKGNPRLFQGNRVVKVKYCSSFGQTWILLGCPRKLVNG